MPHAVTTTDVFLEEISGKLDKIIDLLEPSAPEPPAEPEPAAAPDDKPAPKKAPAKKAATRRKVDGT
jgi:hypothetical protein